MKFKPFLSPKLDYMQTTTDVVAHKKSGPWDWWLAWWNKQAPNRQDRYANLTPVAAVILFLAAIASAFWYLRAEETDREQEAVKRDVEYAQQRLRLRLIERQEQVMRLARDISNKDVKLDQFASRAEALVQQYPEYHSLTWLDERRKVVAIQSASSIMRSERLLPGSTLGLGETENHYSLARDLMQPIYGQLDPKDHSELNGALLQLLTPLSNEKGKFSGVLLAEYSMEGLLRYGVPSEVLAKYAISLVNGEGELLAGQTIRPRTRLLSMLPIVSPDDSEYEVPVSPVGNGLILKAQAWRTSQGLVGSGLFWLVSVLSVMTAWMLIANWRHTRRRLQAQKALVAETSFRRAMENSMLTGMRALDINGRITYVNPAFCEMTGWDES